MKYSLLLLLAGLTGCSSGSDGSGSDAGSDLSSKDQGSNSAVLSVTSISPVTGSTFGTEPVTIYGTGFTDGAQVYFGEPEWGLSCRDVEIVSSTEIKCTTPPRGSRAVDDVVVILNDNRTEILAKAFQTIERFPVWESTSDPIVYTNNIASPCGHSGSSMGESDTLWSVQVNLSRPATQVVTVPYTIRFSPNAMEDLLQRWYGPHIPMSAADYIDYTSGLIVIQPGQTYGQGKIQSVRDGLTEPTEEMFIDFGTPTNAVKIDGCFNSFRWVVFDNGT